MRAIRCRAVTVLVGGVLVALAMLMSVAAGASAEVLVDQPPGPSGVAVPSEEIVPWGGAYDDFVVPAHAHWYLDAIQVFGTATTEHPRTFTVRIYWGGGRDDRPLIIEPEQVFRERVTVMGGPNYLIPIEAAPRLDSGSIFAEPSYYWISVQALNEDGADDWSWLTGPDTPGTAPFWYPEAKPAGAEPGLAFQLLGTSKQTVRAQVSGEGTLVSNPPGISCPGTCVAEFPRGTELTFTAGAQNTWTKFVEWGFRNTGDPGPSAALSPVVIPSPCGGTGTCNFTLNEDTNVGAVFEPIDEVDVLRVVRNRRSGRGELVVWVPGEGDLFLLESGLRSYLPGRVPAGVARIPLIPTKRIAKTLRNKGHAKVSAEVQFRAAAAKAPTVTRLAVTLVRKRRRGPTLRIH